MQSGPGKKNFSFIERLPSFGFFFVRDESAKFREVLDFYTIDLKTGRVFAHIIPYGYGCLGQACFDPERKGLNRLVKSDLVGVRFGVGDRGLKKHGAACHDLQCGKTVESPVTADRDLQETGDGKFDCLRKRGSDDLGPFSFFLNEANWLGVSSQGMKCFPWHELPGLFQKVLRCACLMKGNSLSFHLELTRA